MSGAAQAIFAIRYAQCWETENLKLEWQNQKSKDEVDWMISAFNTLDDEELKSKSLQKLIAFG